MKKLLLAAALLGPLSFGVALPAMAGDPAAPDQVAVNYSDLNLQTAMGQKTLKRRLTVAALGVCPARLSANWNTRIASERCVKQAVGQAMAELSERQLARTSAANGNSG